MIAPTDILKMNAPHVVAMWEAPGPAKHAFDALAHISEALDDRVSAIVVPEALITSDVEKIRTLLAASRLRILPLVGSSSLDPAFARALQELAGASLLYEGGGATHVLCAFNAAPAALRTLLPGNAAPPRFGWMQRGSAFQSLPDGMDYGVDFPPYHATQIDTSRALPAYPYSMLIAELARRHAPKAHLVPSVLWSPTRETTVMQSTIVVTEIAPLKTAYAIDCAERFVRNRIADAEPFWLLRIAFDPGAPDQVEALAGLADELSRPHIASGLMDAPEPPQAAARPMARIAVVLHLFYPELWDEFAEALGSIPERFDLFVSCPIRAAPALRRTIRGKYPGAVVFGVHNLGRDVLPFLVWLRSVGADAYTYVLKLHGKRSMHIADEQRSPFGGGDDWRKRAIAGLLGVNVRAILEAMDRMPDVGIVAPEGELYDQAKWRLGTGDLVATVLARLGLPRKISGAFPAGTMFWARLEALAPFAGGDADLLDFEREAGQLDGTLHHTYERAFALVAAERGFVTVDAAALRPRRATYALQHS